jgi:5-(carboxyamino)imidazole ribonucleotide synthase
VTTLDDLRAAVADLGLPAVLKTTRLGYDGKGQRLLRRVDELATRLPSCAEAADP